MKKIVENEKTIDLPHSRRLLQPDGASKIRKAKGDEDSGLHIAIAPLNRIMATFKLIGTSPYMQNRWTEKSKAAIKIKQLKGSQSAAKEKGKHAPRDFDEDYEQAFHRSTEGWAGIPTNAFRAAMISACRLVGFKMTIAKLAIDIEADGFDRVDGVGLVRIYGEPERTEMLVPNATGVVDIRCRPLWRNWTAKLTIVYDGDIFSAQDISNLLYRTGQQVNIGAGRNDSQNSVGMGFGKFRIASDAE